LTSRISRHGSVSWCLDKIHIEPQAFLLSIRTRASYIGIVLILAVPGLFLPAQNNDMKKVSPKVIDQRIERLKQACLNSDLRMTHQRIEIFREVAMTGEHPDAETIFTRVRKRLPTISHDTVYRTLASLEEMGLVSRVDPVCGRARYDANCDLHHHFVCTECGLIEDVYLDEKTAIPLPGGIQDLGNIDSVHLQVRGVCNGCGSKSAGGKT
jgi:Fur family peroxide stress response transcriptional regulator